MGFAANLVLWGSWLLLFWPSLDWLQETLSHADFRLNLVLMLGAAAALLLTTRPRLAWWRRPAKARLLPVLLVAVSAASFIVCSAILDIDILAALFFGLGSYGLVGLYVAPSTWRKALPAALLLIFSLPFGAYAETYGGFAVRSLSAQGVSSLFEHLGLSVVSTETIIVLENGVAHVDAPCSGLKSLWSGCLFFLAMSAALRRRPDLSWLGLGALLAFALTAANVVRIFCIVLLSVVCGLPKVAEIFHAPLGVLLFAAACGVVGFLLSRGRGSKQGPRESEVVVTNLRQSRLLTAGCSILCLVGAWTYSEPAVASAPRSDFTPRYEMATKPLKLSDSERRLYLKFGDAPPDKRRFEFNGVQGVLLTALSTSWRAHHPPELCLAGSGFVIDGLRRVSIGSHRIRIADLNQGSRTALYWFQSETRITDDVLDRAFAEMSGRERRWVLVSVLLDEPLRGDVQPLFDSIRRAVARGLESSS